MKRKVNPFKNLLQVIYDKIIGVEYGEKTVIELNLNGATTIERIETIVALIDKRCILNFYDAFYELHPTQTPTTHGDSGAFTEIRKDRNTFKARIGNHGGFKNNGKWIKLSKQELIERIFKSRIYNAGKMILESRPIRKQWKKIENEKALYEFHHDITDKKNLC